jgi:hypothetical protein
MQKKSLLQIFAKLKKSKNIKLYTLEEFWINSNTVNIYTNPKKYYAKHNESYTIYVGNLIMI